MSKKKARDADLGELKKMVEESGLGGDGIQTAWSEDKKKARHWTTKARCDVERILFFGTLEEQIAACVSKAIENCERHQNSSTDNFLVMIRGQLAFELSTWFRGDGAVTEEALQLALSFLCLFPELRKAFDKPLTVDEIKALDLGDLLSVRRKTSRKRP